MKIQVCLLLLFFAVTGFAQVDKNNQELSRVSHYRNNISVNNFDGTRSTVHISGNSATLVHPDGGLSSIDFTGNTSTLIATDGTSFSILHNGFSSVITRPDGSQFFVNHMQSSSSCSVNAEKHTIIHNFGEMTERCYKERVDVLIHVNWLLQKETIEEEQTADSK